MRSTTHRFTAFIIGFVFIGGLVACSGGSDSSVVTEAPTTTQPLPLATYTVRPGAHQVGVLDADPGTALQIKPASWAADRVLPM